MESTGVYWKPIYAILEDDFEVIVANAHHIRNVPGRKTDVKDSEWIGELVRHSLLKKSLFPQADPSTTKSVPLSPESGGSTKRRAQSSAEVAGRRQSEAGERDQRRFWSLRDADAQGDPTRRADPGADGAVSQTANAKEDP